MKIIIIGKRSFLSKSLNKLVPKSKLVSSNFIKNKKYLKKYIKNDTCYIINSFYPLFKILGNKANNKEMISQSVIYLTRLIELFSKKKNIKILYSSTCAVSDFNSNIYNSRSVYTSTKIICEQLLKEYCKLNNTPLVITRLFNLYGGADKASIIYKIITASKDNVIKINNNGDSKRDFIHVDDVAKIYKKVINSKFSGLIEIGTGRSVAIKSLIKYNKNYILSKKKLKESNLSIAEIKNISKFVNVNKFLKVEKYVKDSVK